MEEQLNSMKAIWTRRPEEVTKEEYDEFYRNAGRPKGRKYTCQWCSRLTENMGAEEARRIMTGIA